jgi:hypothetical protein
LFNKLFAELMQPPSVAYPELVLLGCKRPAEGEKAGEYVVASDRHFRAGIVMKLFPGDS